MALYLDDISVSFDGFKALNALTLTIVVTSLPRLGNTGIYTWLDGIARVAPTLLVGMAVLAVTGLLAANWYLSKKQGSEIPDNVM